MRNSKFKGLFGIIFMALAIVALFVWMQYGKEFLGRSVLVAKTQINEGTVIDKIDTYFEEVKMDEKAIIKNSLTFDEAKTILGKAAKQVIPENGQVIAGMFAKPGVVVSGDKFVYKVPTSWIYAVPSSIRSGDDISFYEIDSFIENSISRNVTKNNDGTLATYTHKVRTGAQKPVLNSTVKYVKDSTNREVVDAEGPKRYDGTSQVSSIEIVCTEAEMKILEARVIDGFKFIVVYR